MENRMSVFCEFQQHFVRDVIPSSSWTSLFSRIPLLFLERGPINDHCPIPNFFASTLTTLSFAKHSSLLPFLSEETSLNIDMNRILPVKVSGASPKSLSRPLILPQSCNVVNPEKMFHSNSVGSPLIQSSLQLFLGHDPLNPFLPSFVGFWMLKGRMFAQSTIGKRFRPWRLYQ